MATQVAILSQKMRISDSKIRHVSSSAREPYFVQGAFDFALLAINCLQLAIEECACAN